MYVYIYIYVYVCIYIYIYTHMYRCIYSTQPGIDQARQTTARFEVHCSDSYKRAVHLCLMWCIIVIVIVVCSCYKRAVHGTPIPSDLVSALPLSGNTYHTLLFSSLLYSTLLYSTLLYSTLLYSTLLYSTIIYAALVGPPREAPLFLLLGGIYIYIYIYVFFCCWVAGQWLRGSTPEAIAYLSRERSTALIQMVCSTSRHTKTTRISTHIHNKPTVSRRYSPSSRIASKG